MWWSIFWRLLKFQTTFRLCNGRYRGILGFVVWSGKIHFRWFQNSSYNDVLSPEVEHVHNTRLFFQKSIWIYFCLKRFPMAVQGVLKESVAWLPIWTLPQYMGHWDSRACADWELRWKEVPAQFKTKLQNESAYISSICNLNITSCNFFRVTCSVLSCFGSQFPECLDTLTCVGYLTYPICAHQKHTLDLIWYQKTPEVSYPFLLCGLSEDNPNICDVIFSDVNSLPKAKILHDFNLTNQSFIPKSSGPRLASVSYNRYISEIGVRHFCCFHNPTENVHTIPNPLCINHYPRLISQQLCSKPSLRSSYPTYYTIKPYHS